MGPGANVQSIEALTEFRAALAEFVEDARDALCANDMEIQRAIAWLDERLKYWSKELRVRQEEEAQAKRNLKQRQMQRKEGRIPDCTEQEEAWELARRRLREAEEKLANCRRWGTVLRRETDQYLSPARMLGGMLEADLPRASTDLERRIAALEAYVGLTAPVTPGPAATAPADVPPTEEAEPTPAESPAPPEPA